MPVPWRYLYCHVFSSLVMLTEHAALVSSVRLADEVDEWEAESAGQCGSANMSPRSFETTISQDQCGLCTRSPKCIWCPLSQSCVAKKFFSMGRCRQRRKHKSEDSEIVDRASCKRQTPPWIRVMNEDWGQSWMQNKTRYADAVRCIEWALGWPITRDEAAQKEDDDDLGQWSCTSALIRKATLAMIENKNLALHNNETDPGKDLLVLKPALCSMVKLKSSGFFATKCSVRAHALNYFAKVRRFVPNVIEPDATDQLRKSILAGPLRSFAPGAGKSGSGFAMSADGVFFFKLGLKTGTATMDEPRNLMKLLKGNAQVEGAVPLVEHFKKNPGSLLNRHYGMIDYQFGHRSSFVTVLGDASYGMGKVVTSAKKAGYTVVDTRYDLKGSSRNQADKKGHGYTLINGDFERRERNKMVVTEAQCMRLHDALQQDVNFLASHNLIDYSLLLYSVQRSESVTRLSCDSSPGIPFCFEHGDHLYTIGIIDYLNNFTYFKQAENMLFMGKFEMYGRKIRTFAEKICPVASALALTSRLQALIDGHHGSVEQAFADVDRDSSGEITHDDLKAFFNQSGLSEGDRGKLLAELEPNGDGRMDVASFESMLRNLGVAITEN